MVAPSFLNRPKPIRKGDAASQPRKPVLVSKPTPSLVALKPKQETELRIAIPTTKSNHNRTSSIPIRNGIKGKEIAKSGVTKVIQQKIEENKREKIVQSAIPKPTPVREVSKKATKLALELNTVEKERKSDLRVSNSILSLSTIRRRESWETVEGQSRRVSNIGFETRSIAQESPGYYNLQDESLKFTSPPAGLPAFDPGASTYLDSPLDRKPASSLLTSSLPPDSENRSASWREAEWVDTPSKARDRDSLVEGEQKKRLEALLSKREGEFKLEMLSIKDRLKCGMAAISSQQLLSLRFESLSSQASNEKGFAGREMDFLNMLKESLL